MARACRPRRGVTRAAALVAVTAANFNLLWFANRCVFKSFLGLLVGNGFAESPNRFRDRWRWGRRREWSLLCLLLGRK